MKLWVNGNTRNTSYCHLFTGSFFLKILLGVVALENYLGNNIKFRRTQLGMTLDDVSEKAIRKNGKRVTRPYINSMENGLRNVSLGVIDAIAMALNTTPAHLVAPGLPIEWIADIPDNIREALAKGKNIPVLEVTAETLNEGEFSEQDIQAVFVMLRDLLDRRKQS